MLTDPTHRDPLPWLAEILWPDGSTDIELDGPAEPRWWASPSPSDPRILVPATAPAAARAAVRRYHDGFDTRLRLRSLAAEAIVGLGPLAGATLRRYQVAAHHRSEVRSGLLDGIANLLGIDDLVVAASLSVPKSNRKPVLQLLDRSGTCHGWAKVAWNEPTERLVANEAAWLAAEPTPPLSIPRLLHDTEIAGHRVFIASAVPPARLPRRRRTRPPGPDLFLSVAAMGTPELVSIKESLWWRSVESVIEHATPRERLAMQAAVEACYRLRIRTGAWHGDLTPWNLMTAGGRHHLIDWEFAADGVPLGFDLCHFHTQVAAELRGLDAVAALDHSARLSPHGLARIGIEPQNRTAVWQLYLVELLRRLIVLRAEGYPVDGVTFGPAALDRLERAQGAGRSAIAPASSAPSPVSDTGPVAPPPPAPVPAATPEPAPPAGIEPIVVEFDDLLPVDPLAGEVTRAGRPPKVGNPNHGR
ncbi:MAG: hypothetical protein AAF547_02545 [Actinomycetota bacterium]